MSLLFWNGPAGKVCFDSDSIDVEPILSSLYESFFIVAVQNEIFILSKQSFQLLDKCKLDDTVASLQQDLIQLSNGSVFKIFFEDEKIRLEPSNEAFTPAPEASDYLVTNSGGGIQLTQRNTGQLLSEISGKQQSFLWLDKLTVIGCWVENGKLYVSPLHLLGCASVSNSSALPFILWTEKQMFVHRAPLYPSWIHLERSEQFDVIDSQIGKIRHVAAGEDCKSLVVVNEAGLAAVCDFSKRLWRPVHLAGIEAVEFLGSQFLILKTGEVGGRLHLISLNQAELYATLIPLQSSPEFFACSSDGSLIVQVAGAVHVFSLTSLPSQRQIHFTNAFSCRFGERLKQAAVQGGQLYLLDEDGHFIHIALNTGEATAQLAGINSFLCFDDFVLYKKATWHLYWNGSSFDLISAADAIYPQLPGMVALTAEARNFSLATSVNSSFLLPRLFRLTGQLRLLEPCKQSALVLEYLLLDCRDEPQLLRQLDEFFVGSVLFAKAVIQCCRKIELVEATQIFAHFFNFAPSKIVDLVDADDCLLFLSFLANSCDERAISRVLSKLTGSALEEAQSFLQQRNIQQD